MFCGIAIAPTDLSMEHFCPKCLWEKGHRPARTKTLPAHKKCNESFAEDNEYFRDVLVLEAGAQQNCQGARTVADGTIKRKIAERHGSLRKAVNDLRPVPITTNSGVFVGVGPGYLIDMARVARVLKNVVRGVFYTVRKKPMPQDWLFWVENARNIHKETLERTVNDMVDWKCFGDDVFLCRYRFLDRPDAVGIDCLMRFYQSQMFFAQAVCPSYADNVMTRMFVRCSEDSDIVIPYWCK